MLQGVFFPPFFRLASGKEKKKKKLKRKLGDGGKKNPFLTGTKYCSLRLTNNQREVKEIST